MKFACFCKVMPKRKRMRNVYWRAQKLTIVVREDATSQMGNLFDVAEFDETSNQWRQENNGGSSEHIWSFPRENHTSRSIESWSKCTRSTLIQGFIERKSFFHGTGEHNCAAKFWNDIPLQTKNSPTIFEFECKLKAHLLNYYSFPSTISRKSNITFVSRSIPTSNFICNMLAHFN